MLNDMDSVADPWLECMRPLSAIVDVILRIAHPQLHKFADETMKQLANNESVRDGVQHWSSVYNGVALISNRDTPAHIDCKTNRAWPDVLITAGPYEGGAFRIGGCSRIFHYGSGTVFTLCGGAITHEVLDVRGERVCWAFFLRKDVQRRPGWEQVGWSSESHFGC